MLNLMFLALGGVFVYRRGGMTYLRNRMTPSSQLAERRAKSIESPLYLGRKGAYAGLPDDEDAVIFAGDSITDFCEWHELLERPVLNRGISGDTVEGLRLRIDEVLRHHPRQLFIMVGFNDLIQGRTSDEVLAEYRLLIDRIRTASPRTQILLQSVLPVSSARWIEFAGYDFRPDLVPNTLRVNKALAAMTDGERILYVDLYSEMAVETDQLDRRYTSDGIHLSGMGYIKWRDVVRPYLATRE